MHRFSVDKNAFSTSLFFIYYICNNCKIFFKEKLSKKPKDKRNLFLLRAGFIRPGTTAAAGMSETDADKRTRLAVAARQKLKNLHMFVYFEFFYVNNMKLLLLITDLASNFRYALIFFCIFHLFVSVELLYLHMIKKFSNRI